MTDKSQNTDKANLESVDKTIIEREDTTIIESNQTIRETEDRTVAESDDSVIQQKQAASLDAEISSFRDYPILQQFPATGGEADIYLIKHEDKEAILKLYRFGMDPKEDVLKKAKELSDQFPEHIIGIYAHGYDEKTKRWYEIQEYAKYGSLRDYINAGSGKNELKTITEEIVEGLKILNDKNLLHLDLKPSNILIRTTNPLDLIFTDFGIASILDPELSKKMTKIKGTPLYWSPESFTGVVGKEADYWSFGMIILEMLVGNHPFSGLDTKVIMYTLSTKGVEIPADILEEYQLLLKGLLTREPQKRWSYSEVRKWLNGERDIPVYYAYDEHLEGQYRKPYSFNEKKYYSLGDLVAAFVKTEELWKDAVSHVSRGYITKWLENNEDYDNSVKIEKIREEVDRDNDLILLIIIYTFNKELPFVSYGKLITLQNLHLYAGKTLRKENTKGEGEVTDALLNGKLLEYYRRYLQLTSKDMDDLYELFVSIGNAIPSEKEYSDKLKIIFNVLEFLLNLDKYLLPGDISENLYKRLDIIIKNVDVFMTKEEYGDLISRYIIPQDITAALSNGQYSQYLEAVTTLLKLNNDNLVLTKDEYITLRHNYIIPEEIVKGLNSEAIVQYKSATTIIRKWQKEHLVIAKKEYDALTSSYILPEEIKNSLRTEKISEYELASRKLRKWQNDDVLIKKIEYEEIIKNYLFPKELNIGMISTESLEFENAAYKLKKLRSLILSKVDHQEIMNQFILPDELKDGLSSDSSSEYESAVNFLRKAKSNNHLITKSERDEIINKYFIPKELKRDLSKSGDYKQYENTVKLVRKLQKEDFIRKKKEFKKLLRKYILHKDLKQNLFCDQSEKFMKGLDRFRELHNNNQLIPKSQSVNRFLKYAAIGAVIGIVLRGILVVAGFNNWLFYYYDFMTWMEVWDKNNFESGDFMLPVVFLGMCGCIVLIYKEVKR